MRSGIAFQFISGLASGTFIPLTIGFVAQNPRPGVSAYAMNLELSLKIAASIDGSLEDRNLGCEHEASPVLRLVTIRDESASRYDAGV